MFTLDPQLARDTWKVADLSLCTVLLAKNAVWPWLILVPRRSGMVEIIDLTEPDQGEFWHEINKVGQMMQRIMEPDKLNIAALGNMVRQLHVHVVGRFEGDPGWPGPIWGSGFSAAYTEAQREDILKELRQVLKG